MALAHQGPRVRSAGRWAPARTRPRIAPPFHARLAARPRAQIRSGAPKRFGFPSACSSPPLAPSLAADRLPPSPARADIMTWYVTAKTGVAVD
eukprot:CAMPEP_0182900192 /NCGR_PEP_ID=MMETSP0034_2-20130328/28657_1 /TAXON_ID=156128 /ORGANISM="Nephroselmis pyriformis, Strain CCMP717" /LENGTH=92 /DNA_ID=CAMNT_0025034363 /DNA_START=8 /DNA_END=283 /DNA_ORIENTATION=+